MKALTFKLYGKGACFRIPYMNAVHTNSYYATYDYIPVSSLLGMFGAILGYRGYEDPHLKKDEYPEFYQKLCNLNIAIVPSYITPLKFTSTYTNTTGHASIKDGTGVTLIYEVEQLENPAWTIFVLKDQPEVEKIEQALLSKKYKYTPFLGKKKFPAIINHINVVDVKNICGCDNCRIDSLIPYDQVKNCQSTSGSFYLETLHPTFYRKNFKRRIQEIRCVLTDQHYYDLNVENIYCCNDMNVYFFNKELVDV